MSQGTRIDIEEAQADLLRLIDQLETGSCDEIVILRAGRPVARLLPISPTAIKVGDADGKFVIPHDIDLLNPSIEAMFSPIERDGETS
jgi:antitoxin (DNA-binding transcriptional repressor) of toxin-antitoxin stability system